jgi:hypothetical protein
MSWCWLALGDDDRFTTWPRSPDRPSPEALRVDARLAAGGGGATWVSWCRADGDVSLPFDDGAVSGALRRRLAAPWWPEAVSTLLVDWARIAGAITTAVDERTAREDPFARVFPRRILRVPAGTFGPIPAPTGPGITRYGSGNPWPWDVYAGQVP